jgi:polyprenyl P-hydroxybenzoate/phenylacrylic acid decarboxylase-like protein
MMDIVVGITGATGAIYGVRLLEALNKHQDIHTHLIMSGWGEKNMELETAYTREYVHSLVSAVYDCNDLGAKTSSGSFRTDGMIILPCSMKSLSAIANGYDDQLISRSAGVMIKENRKLVLCPRETPLSAIHLENMLKLARLGVRIVPPMPAFYNRPETLDDIVDFHIMKVLDQFGIPFDGAKRWNG